MSDKLTEKHERMLYPVVRVRTDKAGGSGTVIYCQPATDNSEYEGWETYILTNCHVVSDNIKVEKKWSTLLKRDAKTDVLSDCNVEFFEFEYGSWESGHSAYKAEIMCYDKDMDLALLRLKSQKKIDYVAKLFPRDVHKQQLKMFMPLYAIGCGLGHPPLQTRGELAGFTDIIDNHPYWLTTAPTIFGNSGGAVFLEETYEFIGVPSRIAVTIIGFGGSAITHMSYSIPIISIYKFLEEQMFEFIYDLKMTPAGCAANRKAKRERDQRQAAIDISRDEVGKDE